MQGGQVQVEQSDMRLVMNIAKMAKGGLSHASMETRHHLVNKLQAEVREEKKCEVQFPGHTNLKVAIVRHPAIHQDNITDGSHSCQNGTALNSQTRWKHKGIGASPPDELRQPTKEPMPHPQGLRSVAPCGNEWAYVSEIDSVPHGYVYIQTAFPWADIFNENEYTENHNRDNNCIQHLLTAEGPSTC